MISDLRLKWVQALVQRLRRPLCVFDFETTTFRGMPNFGIAEVYCLNVRPDGQILMHESLINPENPMSERAQRKTGITDAMLADQPTWGLKYAEHFQNLSNDTWTGGFNSRTFDIPAAISEGARYGKPIEKFKYEFDVRDLHLDLSMAKTRNGKLDEVGRFYGIEPRGALHRAAADTVLTFEILDRLVEVYGVEAVAARMLPPPLGAVEKLTVKNIAKFAKGKRSLTIDEVASAFSSDPKAVSFEIGRGLDELILPASLFAQPAAQGWICDALCEVDLDLLKAGKLQPILQALTETKPDHVPLDYVQLRVAMETLEMPWASRREQ